MAIMLINSLVFWLVVKEIALLVLSWYDMVIVALAFCVVKCDLLLS